MKQFNLEEYILNPSRKLVTREGHPVRIICTDAEGEYPIIGLVDGKCTDILIFTNKGKYYQRDEVCCCYDLFFATEKREGWINIFKNDSVFPDIYETQDLAKEYGIQRPGYVDTIKIEWEE